MNRYPTERLMTVEEAQRLSDLETSHAETKSVAACGRGRASPARWRRRSTTRRSIRWSRCACA